MIIKTFFSLFIVVVAVAHILRVVNPQMYYSLQQKLADFWASFDVKSISNPFKKEVHPFGLNFGSSWQEVQNVLRNKKIDYSLLGKRKIFYYRKDGKDYLVITEKEPTLYEAVEIPNAYAYELKIYNGENPHLPDKVELGFYKGQLFWVILNYNYQIVDFLGAIRGDNLPKFTAERLKMINNQYLFTKLKEKYGNPDKVEEENGTVVYAEWYLLPYGITYELDKIFFTVRESIHFTDEKLFESAVEAGRWEKAFSQKSEKEDLPF